MPKIEIPQARVVKGPGLLKVALAGMALMALILVAVYFVAVVVFADRASQIVSSVVKQVEDMTSQLGEVKRISQEHTQMVLTQLSPVPIATPEGSQYGNEPGVPRGLKTYDIGAYLTYGGQAFTLNRASAKLSTDSSRLAIGLFEGTQDKKERPALSLLIEFYKPQPSCSIANIKEMLLVFDLRALGNVAAQRVQMTMRSPSEIQRSLAHFSCDLKPGGILKMQLLGADPKLLKPKGTTFGWGVRLSQEIG